MRRLFSRKTTKKIALAAAVLVVVCVGCAAFLGISGPGDIKAYLGMAADCHPAWRQLAFRRFTAGDSAAVFLGRFPPNDREEFGRYGVYTYYRDHEPRGIQFTGVRVVTRDGRFLRAMAGSCTWEFTFFKNPDPNIDSEYKAYLELKAQRLAPEKLE